MDSIQIIAAGPKNVPYSGALYAGDFIYVSGQVPLDESKQVVGEDIETQTTYTLEKIEALLAKAGANLNHVVKTTVFLTDMKNFSRMNEAYGKKFKEIYPCRSCIEVSQLPAPVQIEIEAVAYFPKK
ncbi:MAG: RidA family protein [Atribacter sp.]|jgi:2-iminobutanoate/2-iminopropanoate deaminase|uniref:RidA family protein n=1 Tax=Atribacter sp. TaxID=2847780 RepID=UPI00169D4210|nr:RidA family protein [Thermotogaceae bacterium]